jgi:hypothetical protein
MHAAATHATKHALRQRALVDAVESTGSMPATTQLRLGMMARSRRSGSPPRPRIVSRTAIAYAKHGEKP